MPHLDYRAFVNSCRDERGVGHHTLRAYAQDLRTFASFKRKHHLTDPLSKDDILAYHRHLRDELCAKPATIERRLVTLKSYFAWRADRNSALPSPFMGVRISIRIPRRLPRPIDRDTLKAILRTENEMNFALQSRPNSCVMQEVTILMIKLLIVTGLRIGELTNLKIRDVSTDASQMIVRGKGNKERMVFVPDEELQSAFRQYCIVRTKHGSLDSPLFLNAVGRRLRSQTFRKRLRVLSHRLGIAPHLTPHRFRHSAATLLIEEGTDIRMVQALLGHANLRTTEIYVRVSNHALKRALARADILNALKH
ncbi:tyrosine-type recombinase/integrase [Roseobacter weihaiensis]|uniref:tyrosine-type recombinase/integrase n=1 Tax=Roseobacter weihaiensis TaxID=2763262 RepID=UPI001D0A8249|nr:tyrosine-type recombinase/integrase [Roseobacter sp. H9]